MMWVRPADGRRKPPSSQRLQVRLAFCDSLRRDATAATEYATVKAELAAKYRNDRGAYTEGKTDFLQRVVAHALRHHELVLAGRRRLDHVPVNPKEIEVYVS